MNNDQDAVKLIDTEQTKGMHSQFNACMFRQECRTKDAELERMKEAMISLARYFTSGNDVPVERAVIRAEDFWRITGMESKFNKDGKGALDV